MEKFRDRIVGSGRKPASQFTASAYNYRVHPQSQREAVSGSLRELGWIMPVIVGADGELIDGHERIWQALQNGDQDVPYVEVDLTPAEARLALAIIDPITGMAETDGEILAQLLAEVNTGDPALQALLAELYEEHIAVDLEPAEPVLPEDAYREQYGVIVICADGAEQEKVYNELREMGYEHVKVVVT